MKRITASILFLLVSILNFGQCPPEDVNGNVIISSQAEIDNFALMYPSCTMLQENLIISGSDITSLVGLNQIESVFSSLTISNTLITNISGLEGIEFTHDAAGISISENPSLVSIQGLVVSTSQPIDLFVHINPNLESLEGLSGITELSSLWLVSNDSLINLTGLENVNSIIPAMGVTNYISVSSNSSLVNFNGLQNVLILPGATEMHITANPSLTTMDGFLASGSAVYFVSIRQNNNLPNLIGLEGLHTVFNQLWVAENESLESFEGLGIQNEYVNDIIIFDNPVLTSLSALNGVTEVGGLLIDNCDTLINLAGLENLYVQGLEGYYFWLRNNDNLADLSAIEDNVFVGLPHLDISGNSSLSICHVTSICNFLESGGVHIIENNAPGCNNAPQVLQGCETLSVLDFNLTEAVQIYPNPVSETLRIESSEEMVIQTITVYSILGETVLETFEESIDFSSISSGVYFVEVETDRGSVVKRIVKQ